MKLARMLPHEPSSKVGTQGLQNGAKISGPGVLTSADPATKVREVRRPLQKWTDSELAKAQADILEYEVDDDIWPKGRPEWTMRVHRASYEAAYSVDPAWAEKTIRVNDRDVFLQVWREIALRAS